MGNRRDELLDAAIAVLGESGFHKLTHRAADAAAGQDAAGPHRALTLARYAILVEAAIHPPLRTQLGITGAWVNTWFTGWLRIAGSTAPERDGPIIMNYL